MLQRIWLTSFCAVALALTGGVILAEEHDKGRDREKGREQEQGRERAGNSHEHHGQQGLKKGHARGVGHHKFDDADRRIAREWCDQHRREAPLGFRDRDRLPPALDTRLQIGRVLDPDLRRLSFPLPTDLLRRLPRPAVGGRYVAIGGHVGLLDPADRLQDLIRLPF